jgi:hypothetical protein
VTCPSASAPGKACTTASQTRHARATLLPSFETCRSRSMRPVPSSTAP